MELFDSEGNLKTILEEIKKTDSLYSLFKTEFSRSIYFLIQQFYPDAISGEETDTLLHAYSVAILNATESVIDKDRNYPLYRLEEELGAMKRITQKMALTQQNNAFAEAVHQKAKEHMVNAFRGIFDLSSTGFRLLEQNAKLYNWEFASNFEVIYTSM